ncbi:DUF4190 domain-containing protein [Chloroflexus sp.]|uniref:DUF4190 domain-containing protein n=1 Tax=Chloroflexus sp. TaxID=1904827 RepID=UPI0029FBF764|nr:DUF4190 domain-containing protein [Chloroflexus sp.]MCS6889599.1 DUF4190 domain-containing protein [Chloroflexus sp.]
MRQCPTCQHTITGAERFCPACGQALATAIWQPSPAIDTTMPILPARNSRLAIASLICGITTWILFFVPLLLAVPAIICGHLGQNAVKRGNGQLTGGGLARFGLVLGYAHVALTVVAFCVVVAVIVAGL